MQKSITITVLTFLVFSCSLKQKPTKEYSLEDNKTKNEQTSLRVRIPIRYDTTDLINIANNLKNENTSDNMLSIHFYLPGEIEGINSSYAHIFYPNDPDVKKNCTIKDENDRPLDFNMTFPLTLANKLKAKKIINEQYKNFIGKFIIPWERKIVFVYHDVRDDKTFIADFYLDSDEPQNIVVPLIKTESNQTKFIYTQEGDYIILKDSIFSCYKANKDKPYFAIKSGI